MSSAPITTEHPAARTSSATTAPAHHRLIRVVASTVPTRALSALCGVFARVPLPRPLRRPAWTVAARLLGARRDEAERPLADYPSFATWFCRRLRHGARPVDRAASLLWPCDGTLAEVRSLEPRATIQAKGRSYEPVELLGLEPSDTTRQRSLPAQASALTVYLHPGDYHRVHSPADARVESVRRIAGRRLPLHRLACAIWPDVYARNARVVVTLRLSKHARLHVVLVASFNVDAVVPVVREGDHIQRGDELGWFRSGSSVVIVSEGQRLDTVEANVGARVTCGTAIPVD